MKKNVLKNKKGITLLELVVAMAIFVVVITIAVGGFISLIRLQGQTETMTDVQQNGRIALEQMTRLARQAEILDIDETVTDFHEITFSDDSESICFKVDGGSLKKYSSANCSGTGLTLTSSDVVITKFTFEKSPGIPMSLDINLVLQSRDDISGGNKDSLTLETTVILSGLK